MYQKHKNVSKAQKCVKSTKMYWASYISCDDYPFIDRLNDIIHRIRSAGLFQLSWEKEAEEQLNDVRLLNRNINRETATTSNIVFDQFQFIKFIIYGYIAACLVFALEIFWVKIKTNKTMRRGEESD